MDQKTDALRQKCKEIGSLTRYPVLSLTIGLEKLRFVEFLDGICYIFIE